jgi:hypothetical protein
MSFSYVRGNPDNLVGGSDASMNDIQGPFYDLRDHLNANVVGAAPLVTALPSSPLNGQECYFSPQAGTMWHLRYNDASASPYKWEVVGGPPLRVFVQANESTTGGGITAAELATPVRITAPLTGEYIAAHGASIFPALVTGSDVAASAGLLIGGVFGDTVQISSTSTTRTQWGSVATGGLLKTLTAAQIVAHAYQGWGVGKDGSFERRWITLQPVRVQ